MKIFQFLSKLKLNQKNTTREHRDSAPLSALPTGQAGDRQDMTKEEEKIIEKAVSRTIQEYGEALKKLGNE